MFLGFWSLCFSKVIISFGSYNFIFEVSFKIFVEVEEIVVKKRKINMKDRRLMQISLIIFIIPTRKKLQYTLKPARSLISLLGNGIAAYSINNTQHFHDQKLPY